MESETRLSRRKFLKLSGAAGAVVGGAGAGLAGYQAGRDPKSYTGWQYWEGGDQTFNRARWRVEGPTYEIAGPTTRPDTRTYLIWSRRGRLMKQYKEGITVDDLDDLLREYYRDHPEDFQLDVTGSRDLVPKQRADARKYGDRFKLALAWSRAISSVRVPGVSEPPEKSDFPQSGPMGGKAEPLKMKSPQKTAKLVKKITHELGSVLVGIARLNPDWVYLYPNRGRGFEPDKELPIPDHWEYAVVVGSPMSWDPMYANPNYGTSYDAYSRSAIVGHRLATFIKQLGYAARAHTPPTSYDLMVPPICIDAGLGEQGRHGIVITPELGCNFRPAVVTTNLPLEPDKPIDIGIQDFCATCKICAEVCPSGAIPSGGKTVVRGYRKYQLHQAKCNNFWNSNLGGSGCRLCIAVCPYTRKANWLHRTALNTSLNDPTGLMDKMLVTFQKWFYPGPDPKDYYMPSLGGTNASYRQPPWWLRTEDFIDV